MKNFARNHSLGVVIMAALLFLAIAPFSHCRTSAPPKDNAFGALIYDDNPNIYLYGNATGGVVIGHDVNITFQPAHTPVLHTEQVLFCGRSWSVVDGTGFPLNTPVVITYERVAHTSNQGVGCHTLISVDEVKSERQKGVH